MPKTKRKEAQSEASSSSKKSKKSKDLTNAVYKQFGYGAVKTQLSEHPKQSFRYTGLTVKRDWPIRTMVTQKIAPVGATNVITGGSTIHFNTMVPANQFWR